MIWPLHLTVVSIVVLCGFVGRRLAQKFTIAGGWQGTRICPQFTRFSFKYVHEKGRLSRPDLATPLLSARASYVDAPRPLSVFHVVVAFADESVSLPALVVSGDHCARKMQQQRQGQREPRER